MDLGRVGVYNIIMQGVRRNNLKFGQVSVDFWELRCTPKTQKPLPHQPKTPSAMEHPHKTGSNRHPNTLMVCCKRSNAKVVSCQLEMPERIRALAMDS